MNCKSIAQLVLVAVTHKYQSLCSQDTAAHKEFLRNLICKNPEQEICHAIIPATTCGTTFAQDSSTEELKAEQERDEKEKREEQSKLLDTTAGGPETAAGASGSSSTTLIPPGVVSSSSTSQILQTSTSKSFDKGTTSSTTTFGNKQGDQSGKNKGGGLGKSGDQQSGKKGKDNGRIDVVVPPISLPGQKDVLNNNAPLTMLLVHPNEFKHPKSFEKWAEECEKNPRLRIVGTLARFQAGKSGFIKSHFFIAEDRDLFTLQYKIYGLRERYIAEQQLLGNFAPDCSDPAIGNWLQISNANIPGCLDKSARTCDAIFGS